MRKGRVKMKTEKVLKFNMYQPVAHYREAKIMQDDYIPTLPLPTATTIAGMITYVVGERLESEFKIAVVGNYERKDMSFTRGEWGEFWKGYNNLVKGKDKYVKLKKGEFFDCYKKIYSNRIMYFEELCDVNLTVFFTTESKAEYEKVKKAFLNPKKYIVLGRSEDFVVSRRASKLVEEVEIYTTCIENKREAIKDDILLKNTYVGVDIRDDRYEELLNSGVLYNIPTTYKEYSRRQKVDRVMEYGHFIYLDSEGYYPRSGMFNVYEGENEKIPFVWMKREGE